MKIQVNEGYTQPEIIINCPEISGKVDKILSMLRSVDEKILGVKEKQSFIIDRGDVYYFESVDNMCFFYTESSTFETDFRLYEIEERFADAGFFRSSKSQIINIAKIASICPDFGGRVEVKMKRGEKLIVSRKYTKNLKERLGIR